MKTDGYQEHLNVRQLVGQLPVKLVRTE